jgi:hypothetical protein
LSPGSKFTQKRAAAAEALSRREGPTKGVARDHLSVLGEPPVRVMTALVGSTTKVKFTGLTQNSQVDPAV